VRILAQDTGAVIVDYQEKLLSVVSDAQTVVAKSKILLSGLGILGIPMVVSEQYPKGLGPTIAELADLIDNFTPIEKLTFSCCGTEPLMDAIKRMKRKNIIVCGVEAHVCVLQTVIDLASMGYVPIWVHDCVGSRNPLDKELALWRAQQAGAIVTSAEAILFELTREAGTDTFRAISKLVK